ncbi:MAG: DNA recombination protein RmuC [Acidimicrobiales bacterium]
MDFVVVAAALVLVLVLGVAGGALVARFVSKRDHERQLENLTEGQAVAVEAAVRQVLTEREATAAVVVADRESTVAAAVDNAVKVATATLDARMSQGSKELDLRSASFNDRVDGIGGQLDKVQRLVAQLQQDKAAQHGQLVSELRTAAARSRELHDTTARLREALASPKARGQWGERMAEDVLQAAGFREGVNYEKQRAVPGGGIPDFTFLLPRGLELNMDVKFPIDNYMRFLDADDDVARDKARSAFARDVRARIRELRDRGYIDPERTVETMLLFIPNESVYAFVHENDADLIDQALQQKVVLCSPLTLFSVLAIVRQAVDNFRLELRSGEILDFLVEFRGEWDRFTDHLDKTGRQLETFQKSWEALGSTRRNQLERKLRRIDELEAEHETNAQLVPLDDKVETSPVADEAPDIFRSAEAG